MPIISASERFPQSAAHLGVTGSARRRRPVLVPGARLIAALDSLAAVVAILAVFVAMNVANLPESIEKFLSARVTVKNVLLLALLAIAWPLLFRLFGLYELQHLRRLPAEVSRLLGATAVGAAIALAFPLTSASGRVTVWDIPRFWFTAFSLCLLIRAGWRFLDRARHRHVRRTLIVGTGHLAQQADRDIRRYRTHRYEVVGFVDEPVSGGTPPYSRVPEPMIGTLDELEQILMRQVIDEVVIALPVKSRYQQIQHVIGVCELAGVQAKYSAEMFHSTVAFPRYDSQSEGAFVAMQVAPDGYRLVVKRAIDVVGATVGLVLLTPLMLVVAASIKMTSSGPVIYAQDRCGLNKRGFRMYKFRSMYKDADKSQAALEHSNEAEGPVFKIRDDPRIMPLGRLLRKSSIDELPQLWNVLRGDMSLVGPRPLPWRDVNRIARPSDMRRFSMRPGLTCIWQVQGRSNIGFERWVQLDLEYIDTWSLVLDLQLLVRTIPAVLSTYGAT